MAPGQHSWYSSTHLGGGGEGGGGLQTEEGERGGQGPSQSGGFQENPVSKQPISQHLLPHQLCHEISHHSLPWRWRGWGWARRGRWRRAGRRRRAWRWRLQPWEQVKPAVSAGGTGST